METPTVPFAALHNKAPKNYRFLRDSASRSCLSRACWSWADTNRTQQHRHAGTSHQCHPYHSHWSNPPLRPPRKRAVLEYTQREGLPTVGQEGDGRSRGPTEGVWQWLPNHRPPDGSHSGTDQKKIQDIVETVPETRRGHLLGERRKDMQRFDTLSSSWTDRGGR